MLTHEMTRRAALAAALVPLASAIPVSQVKLGVTTDEIDDDVAAAAAFLKEFKLQWAEVRNIWGKYNTAQPVDRVKEARAIFDKNGIRTSILGTGFFKIPLPPDTPEGRGILDNQWSLLDGAMERAKVLGTDKLRIFAFTHGRGEKPDRNHYPRIYELVTEAARRAQKRGMRLAVENVGESYVWSGAQAAGLLKHIKHDSLGLTWDPNNAGTSGEQSFPDGYKLLDPARIMHVHLRDYRKTADGKYEWCAVGDGQMDNLNQIRSLLKSGYKESFTLETHYKHPLGKAHASRTSLTALLKVFEAA
jgi:sugar phosphate isomerase/epimerase